MNPKSLEMKRSNLPGDINVDWQWRDWAWRPKLPDVHRSHGYSVASYQSAIAIWPEDWIEVVW